MKTKIIFTLFLSFVFVTNTIGRNNSLHNLPIEKTFNEVQKVSFKSEMNISPLIYKPYKTINFSIINENNLSVKIDKVLADKVNLNSLDEEPYPVKVINYCSDTTSNTLSFLKCIVDRL